MCSEKYSIIGPIVGVLCFVMSARCQLNFNDVENINKNFKSVPTTVKTFENDTVLLPCYHIMPFQYIRWRREGGVLLVDSRHPENPPPERIHLWLNGSLQVSNVQAEDTGEYFCEVMAAGEHAVQLHAIEVQYPPVVRSTPSGVLEVPVGAVFEIFCEAKGMPYPIVTWRRQGVDTNTERLENKRRLLVEVESREMSGPIECVATNGVRQPATAGIHLNVLFKPETKAIRPVVHTKINMRAHLECLVESAPAATVHWFHHGVPIQADIRIGRHDVELQGNRSIDHYYTESKHLLIIKKVLDHDLGIYECRANNNIGYQGSIVELTGRPMASIFKTSPTVATPLSHNLIWQTESLSPIIEYKLRFKQIPSGNVTPNNRMKTHWNELTIPADFSEGPIHTIGYTLHGLQPASVYEASVTSRNIYGWSDNSKVIRFATGGEIYFPVELPNYSTESEVQEEEIHENFLTDLSSPMWYSSAPNCFTISLRFYVFLTVFVYLL